jgi:hypothetical protein
VTPDDFELSKRFARIGYIARRNINYDIRGADGDVNLLPKLARELAAAKGSGVGFAKI